MIVLKNMFPLTRLSLQRCSKRLFFQASGSRAYEFYNSTCKNNRNVCHTQRHFSSQQRSVMSDDVTGILSIPPPYLRDMDPNNFDETTRQRTDVVFDVENCKPADDSHNRNKEKYTISSCERVGDEYSIEWADGVISRYSSEWVESTLAKWNQSYEPKLNRIMWSNLKESDVRSAMSMNFRDVVSAPDGMTTALRTLYQYGILLVTETPIDDGGCGVAALASAVSGGSIKNLETTSLLANYNKSKGKDGTISLPNGTDGPLRTLYGTVWSTVSSGQPEGSSVADSAYGQGALPLHTDMTYLSDPPGLQIFAMVTPAVSGGESVYADGFALANRLRQENPDAFSVLSRVERTYQSMDPATGWHLEAHGPVISTRPNTGEIVSIRHNDLDRLPDLPPHYMTPDECQTSFYEKLWNAHEAWNELLRDNEFRLVMALQSGDTVLVANQRCMHGRFSFQADAASPRSIMGCYTSQDELNSRFRMEGFHVA